MPEAISTNANVPTSPSDEEQMTKYGITRKTVDVFHHGEYRYSNLGDAIAQAKRVAAEPGSPGPRVTRR
jgi:hypothetical protein